MVQRQLTMQQKLRLLNQLRPDPVCICTNCGKEIIIDLCSESIKLYNKDTEIIVDHKYFICPECGYKHSVYLEDEYIRELQAKYKTRYKISGPPSLLEKEFKEHFSLLRNLYAAQETDTSRD